MRWKAFLPGEARVAYTGTRVEAGSVEPEVESTKTRAPVKRRDVRGAVGMRGEEVFGTGDGDGCSLERATRETNSPLTSDRFAEAGLNRRDGGPHRIRESASFFRADSERDAGTRL